MSTTEKGDRFRDLVDDVLAAAGFLASVENLVQFKKVDVRAIWSRDTLDGERRYGIETKAYKGTLPREEIDTFVTHYGTLVRNGDLDAAWLISEGPVSAHARKEVECNGGLKVFTYREFLRRILMLDRYMRDIIEEYHVSNLAKYYLDPLTDSGEILEEFVLNWMAKSVPNPLAILGGYGQGKSTFALNFAAKLSEKALKDRNSRVPILVRLGEIVDEQSLEGLIGKVLASRYRVEGYHFQTFKRLNEAGMFVIIFDGFDEMKHGMTFRRFQNEVKELLRLDVGDSRIILLGRDTALQNDIEFRTIIDGREFTKLGSDIPSRDRRPLEHVNIAGFDRGRSVEFVRKFLPFKARENSDRDLKPISDQWLEDRIDKVLDSGHADLIRRPVHAQMLCEIAASPSEVIGRISVFSLYDRFIHYLLDREVSKRGRDPRFDIPIRRRFNAAIAWWLWEQGRATTTSIDDLPVYIAEGVVEDIQHEFGSDALKRELMQGCLVEKLQSTIYFPHRSIQEFLVSEYLIDSDLLGENDYPRNIVGVCDVVNSEIIRFIIDAGKQSDDVRGKVVDWLDELSAGVPGHVAMEGFSLFVEIAREFTSIGEIGRDPSAAELWLDLFRIDGQTSFVAGPNGRSSWFEARLQEARTWELFAQHSLMQVVFLAIGMDFPDSDEDNLAWWLSAWCPAHKFDLTIRAIREMPHGKARIVEQNDFMFWMFLSSVKINEIDDEIWLELNPAVAVKLLVVQSIPLGADCGYLAENIACRLDQFLQALGRRGVAVAEIRAVENFYSRPDFRRRIELSEASRRGASFDAELDA